MADVLDIYVGEVGLHLLEFALSILLGDMVADVDLLFVQKHAIDVLDGLLSSLVGLIMNKSVTLGVTVLVLGHLAAQNVAEGSKGVMESLIVDSDIQILDKDVTLSGLAKGRITLGPHDAAGTTLDDGVVEFLKGFLAVSGGVVVDIGVSKGATGDGIAADADRGDRTDLGEELEQHGLCDGGVKFSDVQRGGVLGVGSSRAGSRSRGILRATADISVNSGLGITAVDEGNVVEVVGKLINSAGKRVGSHFWLLRMMTMNGSDHSQKGLQRQHAHLKRKAQVAEKVDCDAMTTRRQQGVEVTDLPIQQQQSNDGKLF